MISQELLEKYRKQNPKKFIEKFGNTNFNQIPVNQPLIDDGFTITPKKEIETSFESPQFAPEPIGAPLQEEPKKRGRRKLSEDSKPISA